LASFERRVQVSELWLDTSLPAGTGRHRSPFLALANPAVELGQRLTPRAAAIRTLGLFADSVIHYPRLPLMIGIMRYLDPDAACTPTNWASSALAVGSEDAGFCPVMRLRSVTAYGCQSAALE
jgi:hypothetical protein